ncbi:MAG: hypothetical protein K2L07_09490 [Lachnospiraceae bacterium]|nr:hypothetical protein [Lachnospiraceae bacterium]
MGMFNYLHFKQECPKCGIETSMEAEIKLGELNLDSYNIGDSIKWGEVNKRPIDGSIIDKGYVECENCHKDFWVKVIVINDIIADVQLSDDIGYI